jgi:hypothetical protein
MQSQDPPPPSTGSASTGAASAQPSTTCKPTRWDPAYRAAYYAKKKQDHEWMAQRRAHNLMKKNEAYRNDVSERRKSYMRNARARGYEWLLSDQESASMFRQPCHYCLRTTADVGMLMGIDRKDNSEGYSASNTVPCCRNCNIAKGASLYESFIAYLEAIAKNHAPK